MRQTINKVITAVTVLFISIAFIASYIHRRGDNQRHNDVNRPPQQDIQKLRLVVPDADWERFFFKALEEHTNKINLPSLRTVVLPNKDDIEARFWVDGLPNTIKGFVLRRTNKQWSATCVNGKFEQPNFAITEMPLTQPKSGWNRLWEQLTSIGISTLPDASETNCDVISIDGVGYVVEINHNWSYRTYSYHNPQLSKCNEAKQIISIRQTLSDEFSMK